MTNPVRPIAKPVIAVAPMMAWTDTHCRYLHRLYAPDALLFTEMVTANALIHGEQWQQLDYDAAEHPVALQLGGNEPGALALCAKQAEQRGYDEINLNVGCPSSRVQQGTFGACLMKQPQLVSDCIAAMQDAVSIPVTVKCRLGVDDYDSDMLLHDFVGKLTRVGMQRVYLHMRKAILGGLSPAQNRSIPPLQPERARHLKETFPELEVITNGGITSLAEADEHLQWADGVMIGRAAYHNPEFLTALQQRYLGHEDGLAREEILQQYCAYIRIKLAAGERLNAMTRHMLHSCNGIRGARRFRQVLSDAKRLKAGDVSILEEALAQVA